MESKLESKTSTDPVREFVIAGHGNLPKVKEMLASNPRLLNASYKWGENDTETAIQAAAQLGNVSVAEFLLENGAPLDICTAAAIGREDVVKEMLDQDPSRANAVGAHGIPLLSHSVWSGNLELVKLVYGRGAQTGANLALHNAIMKGDPKIVGWLLDYAGADITSKNYQGKSALTVAKERNSQNIVQVLEEHGAKE